MLFKFNALLEVSVHMFYFSKQKSRSNFSTRSEPKFRRERRIAFLVTHFRFRLLRRCASGVAEALLLFSLGIFLIICRRTITPDETLSHIWSQQATTTKFYSEWPKKSDTSDGSPRNGSLKFGSSRRISALSGLARRGVPGRDPTAAQVHEDAAGIYLTLYLLVFYIFRQANNPSND